MRKYIHNLAHRVLNEKSVRHAKHFRPADSAADLVSRPEKAIVLAAILVLAFVSWQVSQSYLLPSGPTGQPQRVLGASDADEAAKRSATVDEYRLGLRMIVSGYLADRSGYLEEAEYVGVSSLLIDRWQSSLSATQDALLDLRTPSAYQEVHLSVAVALAKEAQVLRAWPGDEPARSFLDEEESVNALWAELLTIFQWLNS